MRRRSSPAARPRHITPHDFESCIPPRADHPPPPPWIFRRCRRRDRRALCLDFPHESLFRSRLRSFRRGALLRPRRHAAEVARRGAALAVRRAQALRLAGLGRQRARRHAAAARRGQQGALLVRRTRELADPDRRSQHPRRPRVVDAGLAGEFCGPEASQRSRHRVRRAADDRCRAGVARTLRPFRCADAVAARREVLRLA